MAAFSISDVTIKDPEAFQIYRARAVRAQALSRNLILVDGMDDVMSHDGDINQ